MPELPETETIARSLNPVLTGKNIIAVKILDPSVVPMCCKKPADCNDASIDGRLENFVNTISDRKITGMRRRGKLIVIDLSPAASLAFHLKMTGRLFIASEEISEKHVRLMLTLNNNSVLYFHDQRRFGLARAFDGEEGILSWPFYAGLGLEPLLSSEEELVAALLKLAKNKKNIRKSSNDSESLKKEPRGRNIKSVLLDQNIICGIGNIYADESLHLSGIHPDLKIPFLSEDKLILLIQSIRTILERAIAAGGSTIRDYKRPDGLDGAFQKEFLVYGRAGLPCKQCGQILEKIKVAGRSTVYCPVCQRK